MGDIFRDNSYNNKASNDELRPVDTRASHSDNPDFKMILLCDNGATRDGRTGDLERPRSY
jgi:hypothetical protein